MDFVYSNQAVRQLMSLPLSAKVDRAYRRIDDWVTKWRRAVYVSYSGGKDSEVLLHLVRQVYPKCPAVFIDTGLEFPEIRERVKAVDNVTWVKPKMNFKKVLETLGYPVISKEQSQYIHEARTTKSEKLRNLRIYGRKKGSGFKISEKWKFLLRAPFKISDKCCDVMKKRPAHAYEKETGRKSFIGTKVADSNLRAIVYRQHGCNDFGAKRPVSKPISIFTDDDVWEYIKKNAIPYSKIYDMGYVRTGCVFCMFGCHMEKESRFTQLGDTHPKLYKYCMEKLKIGEVLSYCGINNYKPTPPDD